MSGTSAHAAATSPATTVHVSQVPTIAAKPTRVRSRAHFTIYGAVAPGTTGEKVTLERKAGGSWHNAGSAKLERQRLPNGKTAVGYAITVKAPAKKASDIFRVVVPATTTNAAGASKTVTVTIT